MTRLILIALCLVLLLPAPALASGGAERLVRPVPHSARVVSGQATQMRKVRARQMARIKASQRRVQAQRKQRTRTNMVMMGGAHTLRHLGMALHSGGPTQVPAVRKPVSTSASRDLGKRMVRRLQSRTVNPVTRTSDLRTLGAQLDTHGMRLRELDVMAMHD